MISVLAWISEGPGMARSHPHPSSPLYSCGRELTCLMGLWNLTPLALNNTLLHQAQHEVSKEPPVHCSPRATTWVSVAPPPPAPTQQTEGQATLISIMAQPKEFQGKMKGWLGALEALNHPRPFFLIGFPPIS